MNNNKKTHRYTDLSDEDKSTIANDIFNELTSQLTWAINDYDLQFAKEDVSTILGFANVLAKKAMEVK